VYLLAQRLIMREAYEKPMVSIDPRYLLTGDVVERSPDERPKHDTIDAILDWLAGPAQQIPSLTGAFDEFAWRMLAAGFPLLRTTLHTRTLHPQYLGASFVWLRTTGQTAQTLVAHEVEELPGHENNPVWKVGLGGETLRRRVDVADDELDFPILHDLKAEGATDYFALPVKSALGTNYTVTYATDRIGGFTAQEISDLTGVSQRLPLLPICIASAASPATFSPPISAPRPGRKFWPARSGGAPARKSPPSYGYT
jgi:adenylate cyclase